MTNFRRFAPVAALALAGLAAGCKDFLTGGELTRDPNRPTVATSGNLLIGAQANLWAIIGGDPARVTGIWSQEFAGGLQQYANYENYGLSEQTTNGFHQSLYAGGGLVDIRRIQDKSRAAGDTLFLGIGQVMEGFLMGTGADLFGNLVYSEALKGKANPALDKQIDVYNQVQNVLAEGIKNLEAPNTGGTNVGPGSSDLVYGGDADSWIELAHTLRARFYMHTAEVDPTAYQKALDEAKQGISSHAGDYVGVFSGNAQEQNLYYQFNGPAGRQGYLLPNPSFLKLLETRSDPRRSEYFNAAGTKLSATRLAPNFSQPFVTYNENLLIWAEAAYRTNDPATALIKLNQAKTDAGVPTVSGLTGPALLAEILLEKYIADFQLGVEAWKDYERTCTPNIEPTNASLGVPARLFYDAGERQTNTNIPQPGQGINARRPALSTGFVDPANATSDADGTACKAQR